MHFWINKTQTCAGFSGRYVPPSISAGARRKPMVTPVHRFAAIDAHHAPSTPCGRPTAAGPAPRQLSIGGQRVVLAPASLAPAPSAGGGGKLKCAVWTLITLLPFVIVTAKYYLNGAYLNTEILVFFVMLVLLLLVIGVVSLFEAFGHGHRQVALPAAAPPPRLPPLLQPTTTTSPPPYHIAVMLPPPPPQPPPPSYEKAVT